MNRDFVSLALLGTGEIIYSYSYGSDVFRYYGSLSEKMPEEGTGEQSISGAKYALLSGMVYPEDLPKMNFFMNGTLSGPIEIRLRPGRAGEYIWCSVEGRIMKDSYGSPYEILGTVRDITAEKKREIGLLEMVERDPVTNFLFWDVGVQILEQISNRDKNARDASYVYLRIENMAELSKRLGNVFRDAMLSRIAMGIREMTTDNDRKIRVGENSMVIFFQTATAAQIQNFKRELMLILDRIDTGSFASLRPIYSFKLFNSLSELMESLPPDELQKGRVSEEDAGYGDMVNFAFNLVGRSNNITNAMDMLLERMGLQLRIDSIHIFQKDMSKSRDTMGCIYAYTAELRPGELKVGDNVSMGKEDYGELSERYHDQDAFVLEKEYYRCLSEDIQQRLAGFGSSILVCPIRSENQVRGMAVYEKGSGSDNWSESLKTLLVELTNIIGNYILREIANDASAAKSNFLASMSHEIRTPMNAIAGFAELILAENGISENTKRFAGNIRQSTGNLLSIINQILDFSKIESGKFEIVEDSYSVSSLLYDVCAVIGVQITEQLMEFKVDIADDIPEGLFGDMGRIRQIFINLLNNSLKYTEVGEIRLKVSWEAMGEDMGKLKVTVQDTGIGIRKEDIDKIFDSYTQVDTKRNRGITGTGLGLSVVRSFLKLMNGDIEVESVYGEGSTFRFYIPQKITDPTPCAFRYGGEDIVDKSKFQIPFLAPKAKLLIVDDTAVNLEVAKGLFGRFGVQVTCASSGQQAIEYFKRDPSFDIIFMDQMMPVMDGIEATQRIRELKNIPEALSVPIIALTANAIKGVEKDFYEAGMNDYFTKPIEMKRLAAVLDKWIPEEKKEEFKEGTVPAPSDGEEQDIGGIEGVDTAKGLDNCLKNVKSYLDLLSLFISSGDMEKADEELKMGDLDAYRITVHAMKSSARYIGAEAISDAAKDLEDHARDRDRAYIEVHHGELKELYNRVSGAIARELDSRAADEEDKRESIPEEELAEILTALVNALEEMDADTAEEEADRLMRVKMGDEAEGLSARIKADIDNFDYDEAAEKCGKIRAMLNFVK